MSTPLTDDSPDLGPYRSSRSRALASSDGPLPVTLHVGPPAPFAGTFGLTSLAAGCGLMWWGELVVPARDWPQRLRPVWQSVGILALFTTGLACAGCALLTICFASCTVEFSRRHLRHELRLGWLCLHRTLPLAGVFSFELRELRHRGRSAIGGKEYRLFAHTRELGEVTLIPNMDRYARAEIGPLVRALTALVRAEAARPEGR